MITVIYCQDIMLDDNTVRISLFRLKLTQHSQSRYFSDKARTSMVDCTLT